MNNNNPSLRPSIFIGSSAEGLEIAKIIQLNLDHDAETTIWSQGLFGLTEGGLDSLITKGKDFDFSVLVLSPDDVLVSRDNTKPSPRDNVIFELGLFIGLLGKDRCIIIHERGIDLKIPSDLLGYTAATFQKHSSGNQQAALGAATTQISLIVKTLGKRTLQGDAISGQTQFQVIADLLDASNLQHIIALKVFSRPLKREGSFMMGGGYEYAKYRAVGGRGGSGSGLFRVSELCSKLAEAGILESDVVGKISLSPKGDQFSEWLISNNYKAEYFWCEIGTWGERPLELKNQEHPSKFPTDMFSMQRNIQEKQKPTAVKKIKRVNKSKFF